MKCADIGYSKGYFFLRDENICRHDIRGAIFILRYNQVRRLCQSDPVLQLPVGKLESDLCTPGFQVQFPCFRFLLILSRRYAEEIRMIRYFIIGSSRNFLHDQFCIIRNSFRIGQDNCDLGTGNLHPVFYAGVLLCLSCLLSRDLCRRFRRLAALCAFLSGGSF